MLDVEAGREATTVNSDPWPTEAQHTVNNLLLNIKAQVYTPAPAV